MTVESTITLILGSSVISGLIGAYAQASRQREEAFRELMIDRAVKFDGAVEAARAAIREAQQAKLTPGSGDTDSQAEGITSALKRATAATDDCWALVPVLVVVFPDSGPEEAAAELLRRVEELVAAVDEESPNSQRVADARKARADEHQEFMERVNHAIYTSPHGGILRRRAVRKGGILIAGEVHPSRDRSGGGARIGRVQ
jgi:hypothetical protein